MMVQRRNQGRFSLNQRLVQGDLEEQMTLTSRVAGEVIKTTAREFTDDLSPVRYRDPT